MSTKTRTKTVVSKYPKPSAIPPETKTSDGIKRLTIASVLDSLDHALREQAAALSTLEVSTYSVRSAPMLGTDPEIEKNTALPTNVVSALERLIADVQSNTARITCIVHQMDT